MIKTNRPANRLSIVQAGTIFLLFTAWFYLLVLILIPFLKTNWDLNPALHWFITGYFLFIPLFVTAIWGVVREGANSLSSVLSSLRLKRLTRNDWIIAFSVTLIIFVLNGAIMGISMLLHKTAGTALLETTPPFMKFEPFAGREKLLLLIWLPMFVFNILGEELLWRGYIQTRMRSREKQLWPLLSLFWLIFHLPFGLGLMIMLLPCMILLPWAVYKTQNAWVGVIIHGVYNGPMFVLISLGIAQL